MAYNLGRNIASLSPIQKIGLNIKIEIDYNQCTVYEYIPVKVLFGTYCTYKNVLSNRPTNRRKACREVTGRGSRPAVGRKFYILVC